MTTELVGDRLSRVTNQLGTNCGGPNVQWQHEFETKCVTAKKEADVTALSLYKLFSKAWINNRIMTLQSRTGPVQGQNRVFPVKFSTQGKTCFHYREPLFSLQGPLFLLQGMGLQWIDEPFPRHGFGRFMYSHVFEWVKTNYYHYYWMETREANFKECAKWGVVII